MNVISITAPPLRERREDVAVLAQHFLRLYAAKNDRRLEAFSDDALACREAYGWPGNVRELENVVERAIALETSEVLTTKSLPEHVLLGARIPDAVYELPQEGLEYHAVARGARVLLGGERPGGPGLFY